MLVSCDLEAKLANVVDAKLVRFDDGANDLLTRSPLLKGEKEPRFGPCHSTSSVPLIIVGFMCLIILRLFRLPLLFGPRSSIF